MGQNQWYHFGVGEFTTGVLGILSHGHLVSRCRFDLRRLAACGHADWRPAGGGYREAEVGACSPKVASPDPADPGGCWAVCAL